jgi:hypothetical protein
MPLRPPDVRFLVRRDAARLLQREWRRSVACKAARKKLIAKRRMAAHHWLK